MFLETVHADGLAHRSYILGDAGKTVVIDPRRDCRVYVDIAVRHGSRITHILETHRHEDFVSGALELARRTGAKIHHGNSRSIKYGEVVRQGSKFEIGNILLHVLETPGHTPESICLVLYDRNNSEQPIAVFTGDTLFAGDVGRTDLYPALKEELAGKLYDSLHKKLLPLGDHVIVYPAHTKGSVCGKNISDRDFTTIGYERHFNPMLAKSRKEFIRHKVAEEYFFTPYFRQIEKFNQNGIPLVAKLPEPVPQSPEDFSAAIGRENLIVADVRSPEAFAGAHIPGSLSLPLDRLPLLAGWFLPYDRKIGIVAQHDEDAAKARLHLMRMGYDNAAYYLAGGMGAWTCAGKAFASIPVIPISALKSAGNRKDVFLVDVRSRTEAEKMPVIAQRRIWVGDLPQQIKNLPRDRKIIAFCTSGLQAATAASLLRQANFSNVEICLGPDTQSASEKGRLKPTVETA